MTIQVCLPQTRPSPGQGDGGPLGLSSHLQLQPQIHVFRCLQGEKRENHECLRPETARPCLPTPRVSPATHRVHVQLRADLRDGAPVPAAALSLGSRDRYGHGSGEAKGKEDEEKLKAEGSPHLEFLGAKVVLSG